MISQQEHYDRRSKIINTFLGEKSIIYLKGNSEVDRNVDVPFEFRQDSHFQYLTGVDIPGVSMMLIPDEGKYILFAPNQTIDDQVWDGKGLSHLELKEKFQADEIHEPGMEGEVAKRFGPKNVHFLHNRRFEGIPAAYLQNDDDLAKQIVDMRLVKSPSEIAEIEEALRITADSYMGAFGATHPGVNEHEIQAILEFHYRGNSASYSFMPIVTMNGNVLHQFRNGAKLEDGRLLLIDSGAEVNGYSADITRTFPVNGKFTSEQKAIYDIVLRAKAQAINQMRPEINYKTVHETAEYVIANGLQSEGILKGNIQDIVENGAHRLFFVHGLGHAMGLDDHDCGDFKDLSAGYTKDNPRSDKFGLKFLRFARELQPGNVVTIEPGIYFIPALLENPELRKKHGEFVNFDKALSLVHPVSGIRIEDDILVTPTGHRVLGLGIPQETEELEKLIGTTLWSVVNRKD